MNYTDLVTSYGPTILTAANSLKDYFIPAEKKNTNQTNLTWIDPIYALIALGILAKEPEGTKLTFHDNTISFNEPGKFQSIVRQKQGSSRSDLYNLTPAIYYSIQWLNPAENSKYEIIFRMAKEGISRMIEDTYRDNLMTQQYLTATHLRMLNDALAKKPILREDFRIPNHDENSLTKHSYSIWITGGVFLEELPQLLSNFEKTPQAYKDRLIYKMENIDRMHKDYVDAMLEGRPAHPEEEAVEYESVTVKINGDGTSKAPSAQGEEDEEFIET